MRVHTWDRICCANCDQGVGALLAKPADVQAVVEEEMVVRRVVVVSRGLWTFVALLCRRGLREQSPYN
ncbi:hypothetical protein [Lentimonas sp. CC11]|uniref:hypothetical protein n=1 Tax=Lentimonas sp. CC11 TaxID=2676096 RepID=UPI0013525B04|nr:hypothetical protein [Lentimonas sp. CC11]CAA7072074.1 Unannotated [Lentimonas sp. CC11]